MDQDPIVKVKIERIIALKRYEQPPPGYFYLLPDRILARIESGEGESSFWEKWWPAFAIRPSLAYALGLTVCTALTIGLTYAPKLEASVATFDSPAAGERWAMANPVESPNDDARPHGLRVVNGLGSTYPVPAPQTSGIHFGNQDAGAMPVSLFLNN